MARELRPTTVAPAQAVSPWVQLRSAMNHPFVYKKMLRQADPQARPGDIVNLYDKSGQFYGRGIYNPRSQIVVRVLTQAD
jgi:23S rRNA (cytosine1962-C5)-methyltransferase